MSRITDRLRFWSEPPDSPDFDKSWEDWKASKDAAKAGQDGTPDDPGDEYRIPLDLV